MTYYAKMRSPVGEILLVGTDSHLERLKFGEAAERPEPGWEESPKKLAEPLRQLRAYFDGRLTEFDLELAPEGTPFQKKVWAALRKVPYGTTCSYGDIARRIGKPKAFRAVGGANNKNPIAIVIPCHRVIGYGGDLIGYGGGLANKKKLLALEQIA